MKKQILTLAIAAALIGNAYAADVDNTVATPEALTVAQTQVAVPTLNAIDMQAAFQQDAQPMQLAALSGDEMQSTQGAGWWSRFRRAVFAVAIISCSVASGGSCGFVF